MGEPIVLTVNQLVGGSISVVTGGSVTPQVPEEPLPYFTYSDRRITGLTLGSPNTLDAYSYWSPINVIENYATEINENAFNDGDFIVMGEGSSVGVAGSLTFQQVQSVGNQAFAYCINLTRISLPNVTSIGNNAFYNCSGLTSVTIGTAVTSIGNNAFNIYGGSSITLNIDKPISWVETRYSSWGLPAGSTIVCSGGDTISIE